MRPVLPFLMLFFANLVACQQQIFSCNFDEASSFCGGSTFTVSNIDVTQFIYFKNQAGVESYVTDVTSITTQTSASKVCDIPWSSSGITYYFCHRFTANFECGVSGVGLARCNLGKFLYGGASAAGLAYKGSFLINKAITLPELGAYRITFYTYIYCCKEANDTIQLKIKDNSNLQVEVVYRDGLHYTPSIASRWLSKTVYYVATSLNISVEIEFLRTTNFSSSRGFIGFDNLAIFRDPVYTGTKPTTTTTTTTTITSINSTKIEALSTLTSSSESTDTITTESTSVESTTTTFSSTTTPIKQTTSATMTFTSTSEITEVSRTTSISEVKPIQSNSISSGGLSGGSIAGITLGVLSVVPLIAFTVWFIYKKPFNTNQITPQIEMEKI